MKKLLLASVILSISATSFAGPYLGLALSQDKVKVEEKSNLRNFKEDDSATNARLQLGYDVPVLPVRAEFEYNFNKFKDFEGIKNSFGANAFVNIPLPLPTITPYLGLGMNKFKTEDLSKNLTHFMGGVDFHVPLTPFTISAEYRVTPKKEIFSESDGKNTWKDELGQNSFLLKARYEF